MGQIINYNFIKNSSSALILLFVFFNLSLCQAANLEDAFKRTGPLGTAAGEKGAGYNTSSGISIESMISLVITTAISFVGVIFLLLAIYGGYIWMMARGNEQEVEKAKNIIKNAIIGLVVVLAAYAISWYVINALGATTLKETGTELVAPNVTP